MMGQVKLSIDGHEVQAEEGATILEVARHVGIAIPHLCYHEHLSVHGGCRLCLVEIWQRGKSKLVASCAYPVEEGLEVRTATDRVLRVRKLLIELLLSYAPDVPEIRKLAVEHGVRSSRYAVAGAACVLCGLCIRHCDEVKRAHAVGFIGRGADRQMAWIPDSAYETHCQNCMECMDICPTGVFPSNIGIGVPAQLRETRP